MPPTKSTDPTPPQKVVPQCITVVCDDTDVFLLLVHHYAVQQMTCTVIMEGTSSGRTVVDIGETAKKHANIPDFQSCNCLAHYARLPLITDVLQHKWQAI